MISANAHDADLRRNLICWGALASMTLLRSARFVSLRSREGLAIQAIRHSEEAAGALCVKTDRFKGILLELAAFGIAVAGALWCGQAVNFQPCNNFCEHWADYRIFMVLVGGVEGAILGAVLFLAGEMVSAATGVGYPVGLGATAIFFTRYRPRGLCWAISARTGLQLLPLGYRATDTKT